MIIQRFENFSFPFLDPPPVLIPGNFDGVHKGHRKLIEEGLKLKELFRTELVILTFNPHPYIFFHQNVKRFLITLYDEKYRMLSSLGVDRIWEVKFNKRISEISAEHFVDNLLSVPLYRIILGPDHTFGKDRKGGVFNFFEKAVERGIIMTLYPYVTYQNRKISSTRIRELIGKGEIREANKLLGYNFFVEGKIIKGKGRGKEMGFPTLNFKIDELKILPPYGVYAGELKIEGEVFEGAIYFGRRPTFEEKEEVLEVYIIDDNRFRNIEKFLKKEVKYKITFLDFIRKEIKFEKEEDLINQIKKDVELIYGYFKKVQSL